MTKILTLNDDGSFQEVDLSSLEDSYIDCGGATMEVGDTVLDCGGAS
jgi:hypothetical protein